MDSALRDRLILIASLKPGYTINVKDGTIVYRKSLYTAALRSFRKEGRDTTIDYVEGVIKQALEVLGNSIESLGLLREVPKGLRSLKETYSDDSITRGRVENIISRVENTCCRFEQKLIISMEQIPSILSSIYVSTNDPGLTSLCLERGTPLRSPLGSSNHSATWTPIKTPSKTPEPISAPPTPPSSPRRRDLLLEEGLISSSPPVVIRNLHQLVLPTVLPSSPGRPSSRHYPAGSSAPIHTMTVQMDSSICVEIRMEDVD